MPHGLALMAGTCFWQPDWPADSWLPPAGKNYDALLKQLRTELGGLKKKVAVLASLQIHSDGDHAMLSGKALQGYR